MARSKIEFFPDEQQHEGVMLQGGKDRFKVKVRDALKRERRSTIGGGQSLLRAATGVMAAELNARLKGPLNPETGKPMRGKRHVGLQYVKKLGVEKAAYITLRTMIDALAAAGGGTNHQVRHATALIAGRVGRRIEDELRFRDFKTKHPHSFAYAMHVTREENDYRRRSNTLRIKQRLADEETQWEAWDNRVVLLIGMLLIDVAVETTGIFEVKTVPVRLKKTVSILGLTSAAVEEICERDEGMELLTPWYLPTVTEPVPWTKPWGGGYHSDTMPDQLLVKKQYSARWSFEQLLQTPMPRVYKAINALQRTPWSVNEVVYETLNELWKSRSTLAGLPSRDELPFEPAPDFLPSPEDSIDGLGRLRITKEQREALTPEQQKEFKRWKKAKHGVHADNKRLKGKRVAAEKTLDVAELMLKHDRFYFPHSLDWRGRAYATPIFLNPQGPDIARGLLQFADARPMGMMGGYWLAVHGSNCFGNDKVKLTSRIDWVFENEARILEVDDDPFTHLWWAEEAEKPVQFLAFCLEWAEFARSGHSPEFESKLVVSMDGKCNGLQHFSAMLRDPAGAEATNMVPTSEPQDIYGRVALKVQERLRDISDADADTNEDVHLDAMYARAWLASGLIDRKLVKQQVMTLPYGVTRYGMRKQLSVHCAKVHIDLSKHFEDVRGAEIFFTDELLAAINETVVAASTAMKFLQGCAKVANEDNLAMMWEAPSGFPVRQRYLNATQHLVKTTLLGQLVRLTLQKFKPDVIDRKKQVSSISPNFVHSLDAAHMMLTIVAAEQEVFRPVAWAMIHDSYGTHAGDTEMLAGVLRRTFAEMYSKHDVLAEFRETLAQTVSGQLPELPPRGTLDIAEVAKADYFFA